MFKLLKKVVQVGEATIQYPFAPLPIAPGFRGKPVYRIEPCIACGACANACPANALSLQCDWEQGIRSHCLDYGRCIFCGRCEEVCPTGAITLSPDFELAAFTREDLLCRADFQLLKCRQCGNFYAPAKEVAHIFTLLAQTGLPEPELAKRQVLLETCPDCRRKLEVAKLQVPVHVTTEGDETDGNCSR